MDWTTVKSVPRYNPLTIRIARESRGIDKLEVFEDTGFKRYLISAFENGLKEPTDEQIKLLADYYEFPISFFEQWWQTELDFSLGYCAVPVEIDYFRYKVFRDRNPLRISW